MSILEDKRVIKSIWGEDTIFTVGKPSKITKIEVYAEYGQSAGVPWFKIWKEDKLMYRINGAQISGVKYAEEQEGG